MKKGSGYDREMLSELVYEGFGPSGEAIVITATTDREFRQYLPM